MPLPIPRAGGKGTCTSIPAQHRPLVPAFPPSSIQQLLGIPVTPHLDRSPLKELLEVQLEGGGPPPPLHREEVRAGGEGEGARLLLPRLHALKSLDEPCWSVEGGPEGEDRMSSQGQRCV